MANLVKTAAQVNLIIGAIAVTEGAESPNINMGFSGNSIAEGVGSRANVIGGGGYTSAINKINGTETRYATIGGGYDNFIDGETSTTDLDGSASTINGGAHHLVKATHATIGGGSYGEIGIGADYATIGGGNNNEINNIGGVIAGGATNVVSGNYGTVGGGSGNDVTGDYGTVVGGTANDAAGSAIAGGSACNASAVAAIALGQNCIASAINAIAIGKECTASGDAAVALGHLTQATGLYSVAAGREALASGERAVAFGYKAQATGPYSFAVGREIKASGSYSFAFSLADNNLADVTQANTMAILGGKVGVGEIAPSAKLHIAAGTATAGTAPFKLTTGVNLSTPEAGAVEWDGTNLFITQGDGTRKTIAYTA